VGRSEAGISPGYLNRACERGLGWPGGYMVCSGGEGGGKSGPGVVSDCYCLMS
jgi:hypothetical protein